MLKLLTVLGTFGGVTFFLVLSGVFRLLQSQLVALRYELIDKHKYKSFSKNKYIKKLLKNANFVRRVLTTGMIFCAFALGAVAMPFSRFLQATVYKDIPIGTQQTLSVVVFVGLFVLQILVHELFSVLSGALSMEKTVALIGRPLYYLSVVVSPLSWIYKKLTSPITGFFHRKFGSDQELDPFDVSVQISALSSEGSAFSPHILEIVKNTLKLEELDVSDVMVPRGQIAYLDIEKPIVENVAQARKTSHTRYPLCRGGLDDCLGIIHIKDVFMYQGEFERLNLEKYKRPLIVFGEDTPLEKALKKLLKLKIHMALVEDEFGSVIGVLTLENLLEQMVGPIQDEFDYEESLIIGLSENTYRVSGLAPIHELEKRLGITLDTEDRDEVSTFGGLVSTELGKIPEKDERLAIGRLSVRVDQVNRKRLLWATVQVMPKEEEGED